MPKSQAASVVGIVQGISVSGWGPNSAEIVISLIDANGNDAAYAVYAYPSTEPSVFTAFSNLLTAAYLAKTKVSLEYVPGGGPTPQITGLTMPA